MLRLLQIRPKTITDVRYTGKPAAKSAVASLRTTCSGACPGIPRTSRHRGPPHPRHGPLCCVQMGRSDPNDLRVVAAHPLACWDFSMTSNIALDTRLDPRIKAAFAGIDLGAVRPNVSSREELLAQENTPEALAAQDRQNALFNAMDSEDIAPSAGLTVRTETFTSSPDGNTIKIQYIRPDN